MKKITLLGCIAALCAGTISAATVEVTTATMDVATEGSLMKVIADAPSGEITNVEFNLAADTIFYDSSSSMLIDAKNIVIDGTNKHNGKAIILKGGKRLFELKNAAKVTLKNTSVCNFTDIAIRVGGASTLTAENCNFADNFEPETTTANNGGVFRVSGANVNLKSCMFKHNRGAGSYGGGALCAYDAAKVRIEGCTFLQNVSSNGGAIAVNARSKKAIPEIYIANSSFLENLSDNRGGAIYMQTASALGVLTPVIVNCTFSGNINGMEGGALNFWSRASTTMKPILVNNLFAFNYAGAWMEGENFNDAFAFYLAGATSQGTEVPQTVFPLLKNNVYVAAQKDFFGANDKQVEAETIFTGDEKSVWDEGDDYFNHRTPKTFKNAAGLVVAPLAENSTAIAAGVASFEEVEIPTTDQLGNARPATPAAGAVELFDLGGVSENLVDADEVTVWNDGNQLHVEGLKEAAQMQVFDLTGKQVYAGQVEAGSAVTVDVVKGIYVAKVNGTATKVLVK